MTDQQPDNDEIRRRIKAGELGPVEFHCPENASEAEKIRVAKMQAEQVLHAYRMEVQQEPYAQAVRINLLEWAEEMEKLADASTCPLNDKHTLYANARAFRTTEMLLRVKEAQKAALANTPQTDSRN